MEILAALMLVGIVLPAVMKGVSMARILASDSARKYEAMDLAENKLAEILLEKEWQGGAGSGNFEDEFEDYSWTMETSNSSVSGLKQIDVVVLWQQRNRERTISLSTLVYETE